VASRIIAGLVISRGDSRPAHTASATDGATDSERQGEDIVCDGWRPAASIAPCRNLGPPPGGGGRPACAPVEGRLARISEPVVPATPSRLPDVPFLCGGALVYMLDQAHTPGRQRVPIARHSDQAPNTVLLGLHHLHGSRPHNPAFGDFLYFATNMAPSQNPRPDFVSRPQPPGAPRAGHESRSCTDGIGLALPSRLLKPASSTRDPGRRAAVCCRRADAPEDRQG